MRTRAWLLPALVLGALAIEPALAAKNPFGVGMPNEAASAPGGVLPWIAETQKAFYRALTEALGALKSDVSGAWWLLGLSFAYGAVHAAGPGHGKVIISGYMLANGETVKRGAWLAFLAALAQATCAVLLVSVAALALRATSMQMTAAAEIFEAGAYALVLALGLWLVWKKGKALGLSLVPADGTMLAGAGGPDVPADGHDRRHHDHDASCGCGHAHAPSPEIAGRARGKGLAGAAAAVLSVGIRPCSGALIVLVFALSQGVYWAGIASAYLMGLGTALTIAVLATLAVGAKGLARRVSGDDTLGARRVMLSLEFLAALGIAGLGGLLLAGSLYA